MKVQVSIYILSINLLISAFLGCTSRVPQEAMSEMDKQEFSADSVKYQLLYNIRKQAHLKADSLYSILNDYSISAAETISGNSGRLLFWPIFISGKAESQLNLVYASIGNIGDTNVVIANKTLSLQILKVLPEADTLDFLFEPLPAGNIDTLSNNLLTTFNLYKVTKSEINQINAEIEFLRERWMGRLK